MNSKSQLLMIHVLFFALICLPVVSAQSHQAGDIVQDSHDVSMVFVPAGDAMIGATLDEATQKCEELRIENKIPGIGACHQFLSESTHEGFGDVFTAQAEMLIKDFFIDQYEVTIQSYQDCVDDEICNGDVIQYLRDFSPFATTDEPARYISYIDAETYCGWRDGYIPSEAEWEYAARGPEKLAYSWGNEFNGESLNFCDSSCIISTLANKLWNDGYASISPVNAHPQDVSWVGAVGMTGNVSEWTSTLWVPIGSEHPVESIRVIKGGFFGSTADNALLWRRLVLTEDQIREGVGFRCAKHL